MCGRFSKRGTLQIPGTPGDYRRRNVQVTLCLLYRFLFGVSCLEEETLTSLGKGCRSRFGDSKIRDLGLQWVVVDRRNYLLPFGSMSLDLSSHPLPAPTLYVQPDPAVAGVPSSNIPPSVSLAWQLV